MDLASFMVMVGQQIPGGFGSVACEDGSFLFEVGFDEGPVTIRLLAEEAKRLYIELPSEQVNLDGAVSQLAAEIVETAGFATLGVSEAKVRSTIFEF
jgi:hypothetical protein